MSEKTSKRVAGSRRARPKQGGLARQYRFDYSKSRPNRFAHRVPRDAVVVVLDSDVAQVFRDPKRINALLRATIAAVEKRPPKRAS